MGSGAFRILGLGGPDGIFLPFLGYFSAFNLSLQWELFWKAGLGSHNLLTSIVAAGSPEDPRAGLPTRAWAGERALRTWPHPSRRRESSPVGMGRGVKVGSSLGLHAHPGSGHRREIPAALVRKRGFAPRLRGAEGLGD